MVFGLRLGGEAPKKQTIQDRIGKSCHAKNRKKWSNRFGFPPIADRAGNQQHKGANSMRKTQKSAGILLFRRTPRTVEVLLGHPGGPFWARKDAGAWTIPKGEFTDEPPLDAAIREFREETGVTPTGDFLELAPIQQRGGKWIFAFALEGECDPNKICSNAFSMEWPPRSGVMKSFPEIDRAGWFSIEEARQKILPSQLPLLDQLEQLLRA